MKPIISVEGLGKSYTIRHEGQTRYKSLREEIFTLPKRLLSKGEHSLEKFWALKDVNFDIMPGDRVGIIGRNGAGKSTLLKLLSRITEPTTGRITMRGRVASLLEVGTGFHPELTGRENIYLNGAILGMTRAEVRRKFDEIVDFAGVEKFLDTPVKRYSSGMYVRLAFAVAAHLEPEILVVDEVLAVGDADFQKKCLGKMDEVSKGQGRTVLFVSHNMAAIRTLCTHGILLENGKVSASGDINSTISAYINSNLFDGVFPLSEKSKYIDSAIFYDKDNNITSNFDFNSFMRLQLNLKDVPLASGIELKIKDELDSSVALATSFLYREEIFRFSGGESVNIDINDLNLLPGKYIVDIILRTPMILHTENVWDVLSFTILPGKIGKYKCAISSSSCLGSCLLNNVKYSIESKKM